MSSTTKATTSSSTATNSDSQVLTNFSPPTNPILKSAFKVLCVVAVSRTSLDHWGDTETGEWKEHITVMVNRFQNSNITAGLVLATTALLLTSNPPVTRLMAYDTPASYVFAMIAFSAALLSVISGAALVIIYETSTTHKDMTRLRDAKSSACCCGWRTPQFVWQSPPAFCLCLSLSPASALEISLSKS
ncbi:hypothetical protein BDR05DRAFT_995897 [Suillus weaverae]|nr:hypothetical protein BDR05DRAFT_995897 [Suillus weaverae]